MSKNKLIQDSTMSMLPGLFDAATSEGALDIHLGFRQCLSRSMHNSHNRDRYDVASKMSRLMATTVSKEMLDKYCASDPANGMRAEALPAFCCVTGTLEPFQYLLQPLGSDILNPADRDLIELARLTEERLTIDNRIMQIRAKRNLK